MHCLVGTFIKALPHDRLEQDGVFIDIWPVKIILPPNKSRILYFCNEQDQQKWVKIMTEIAGFSELTDFYKLDQTLGQGQFGQVKLGYHLKNGTKTAVKIVGKK